MLSELDSRQIAEWQAFDALSPLDNSRRLEFALAKIAMLQFNANRDPERSEARGLEDFLPNWGESIEQTLVLDQPADVAIARVRAGMQRIREAKSQ
jgi:hypothetical protein